MKKKKKIRSNNITLRRRISIYLSRTWLFLKILLCLLLYLFFFTKTFSSLKINMLASIDQISVKTGFVIKNIDVEGIKHIKIQDITNILKKYDNKSILLINLEDIRNDIKKNGWVDKLLIERRLPDRIYISLKERNPVAIWQYQYKFFLIDENGNKISDIIDDFGDLIHVVGSDANIYAAKLISDLNIYPDLSKKICAAVRFGKRRWNLHFVDDIVVKMPEDDFLKAYDALYDFYKNGKLFGHKYKLFDLRDNKKYYFK